MPLAAIKKTEGETWTLAFIVLLVTNAVKFFSVGRGMDSNMIAETAQLILKNYYYLKIEDLKLFFEWLKIGKYGKAFDRMDGNVILIALSEYAVERSDKAEQLKLDRQTEIKEAEKEEQYFVKVGENYVRDNGEEFEEVETKELATLFTNNRAWAIKNMLIKFHFTDTPEKVKVTFNKPGIGLIKYLLDNRPDLVEPKTKWKEKTNPYYEKMKQIDADESLSPLQKENAKRRLAGLVDISQAEFDEREKMIVKP